MKAKQLRIIKCPNCGYEYLPAEIYYPNNFLGYPKNIVRDDNGKILGFDNHSMLDTETFICDNCNADFEVTSTTNFAVKLIGSETEHYVTKLTSERLFLEEN